MYSLREGLSFCRVDGHLIFLDLRHDRYFRLPARMENIFLTYLDDDDAAGVGISDLLRYDILQPTPSMGIYTDATSIQTPAHSAIERISDTSAASIAMLLDVMVVTVSTGLQLKMRKLQALIDDLIAYRDSKTARASSQPMEQQLLNTADSFMRARPYVPLETSCLLDALAMVRFLARRRLHANIVFGVTGTPFTAHCWIQAGDLILNDTVGNATAHTTIRVI